LRPSSRFCSCRGSFSTNATRNAGRWMSALPQSRHRHDSAPYLASFAPSPRL
jgi:hypothetical protein